VKRLLLTQPSSDRHAPAPASPPVVGTPRVDGPPGPGPIAAPWHRACLNRGTREPFQSGKARGRPLIVHCRSKRDKTGLWSHPKRSPLRAKAGQARRTGSRRWGALAGSQRKAEAKDRRVVKLAVTGPPAWPQASWWPTT
jgi:hypothetical protein